MPSFPRLASLSRLVALGAPGMLALAVGCGGVTSPTAFEEDSSPLEDSTLDDTAVDDTTPPDTAVYDTTPQDTGAPDAGKPDTGSTACPASVPVKGATCSKNGLQCQYGTDPRIGCNTLATCQGTSWTITTPAAGTCPGTAPTCPAKQPTGVCTSPGEICGYGTTSCACSCGPLCGPGSTGYWNCHAATTGCPATPANAGTACPTSGATCTYQCGDGGARQCKDGLWITANGGPGPVSTRKVKDGIAYLDAAETDRIAREVQSMKLASWVYKGALADGRTHMGIVLEDQAPGSYAVDPRSNMVDLYGYSSMLLATAQSQQRQIEQQKKEIDALRGEIDAIKAELRAGKR